MTTDKLKMVPLIRRELSSAAQNLELPLTIQTIIIIRLTILDYENSDQNAYDAIKSGVSMMHNVAQGADDE